MRSELIDLGELCDLLRSKGVAKFGGHVEPFGNLVLVFGSLPPPENASVLPTNRESADLIKDAAKKLVEAAKKTPRGRDGLTAAEQEDVYGAPIDDFPETGPQED